MIEEARLAFTGNLFQYLFLGCLILGFIFLKGKKKIVLIPAVAISIVVLNPLMYDFWYKFNDRAFWRLIWIIPIIPVCAIIPAFVVDKARKDWIKIIAIGCSVIVFSICGFFVYNGSTTTFAEASNTEKLPEDVVAVGKKLLEIDDSPRIVTDTDLSVYLRQYSGKIKSAFARDATISRLSTPLARRINDSFFGGDVVTLSQLMLNNDYEYVVTSNPDLWKSMEENNFILMEQVGDYRIYQVSGVSTEKRTYNARGQVVSVTTIDSSGNPINGDQGYSTISYEYDLYGRVIHEFYTTAEGTAYSNSAGYAGYRCVRNRKGWILEQTWIDENGDPVNRKDTYYATLKKFYDKDGHVVREEYYDTQNNLVSCNEGYAIATKEYNASGQEVSGHYYDVEKHLINIGVCKYAYYINEYRQDGNLSLTFFYDYDNNLVQCGSGYFHQFLQSLKGKQFIVSVRDEASHSLTATLVDDMYELGIHTDLRGKHRNAFYAIVTDAGVIEEVSEEKLEYKGLVDDLTIEIISAGFNVSGCSSIKIDGQEYSQNSRGMNFVIVENGEVTESVAFDTYSFDMNETR